MFYNRRFITFTFLRLFISLGFALHIEEECVEAILFNDTLLATIVKKVWAIFMVVIVGVRDAICCHTPTSFIISTVS